MKKIIVLTCEFCKKSFERSLKDYKYERKTKGDSYKVFCSRECHRQFVFNQKQVPCANCSKIVSRIKSDLKEFCFCSRSCSASFYNAKRKVENSFVKGKTKEVICTSCSNCFTVSIHRTKNNYICDKCREEKRCKKILKTQPHLVKCELCLIEFETIRSKYCKECLPEAHRRAGCKAAASRKDAKRSKNEIHLAKLCSEHYGNVSENETYFNGWDADILLHDYKVAIHWNGPFHYVECGGWHSLAQVQSRDKIKHRNIIECGWINYIIKDMGKENTEKVETEFQKLKEYTSYLDSFVPDYQI